MTVGVDEELRIREYAGDDSANPRAVPFKFLANDDLRVTRTNADGSETVLVRGTHYSVAGAGVDVGGSVTPLAPIAAGTSWRIEGDMSLGQPTDYTAGDDFPAESHERGLDRSMIAHQEARRDIEDLRGRALMVPRGEGSKVLPKVADRAGKFAAFNSVGDVVGVAGAIALPALATNIVTDDGGNVQQDLDGKLEIYETRNHRLVVDETNPEAYGNRVDSIADGKQVDGTFWSAVIQNGGAGYGAHSIVFSDAGIGYGAAGGMGAAIDGPGWGSADVNNRQGSGPGDGCTGTRLGSGAGAGIRGISNSTGDDTHGGYFLKQNPVVGVAGAGPAVWMLNDSTNGEAFRARSASGNTDLTTGIIDRLNGTQGTALFVRITGNGARAGLLRGGATHIVPAGASTGAGAVIAHDFQITANVTGSADARAVNIVNSATGGTDAFGGVVLVDGANTTNYGFFINAANGTTNQALYVAGGISSFGGDIRALSDGTQNIGGPFARFGTIYAATGTINTSDAREKEWLGDLTEAHLRAARRIGAIMGLYQWKSQVAAKGKDGARVHFGVKAQDVIEIFYDEGLEKRPRKGKAPSFRHGFLCYDRWDDVLEPVMVKREVMVEEDDWVDTGEVHLVKPDPFYVKVKGSKRKKLVKPEPYTVPVMVRQKVERMVVRLEQDGERVRKKAGELYGLRLDEFALFLIRAQEARLAALEARP